MNKDLEHTFLPNREAAKKAMSVPDNYFDANAARLKQIPQKSKSSGLRILTPYAKWIGAVAASIALVLYFSLSNGEKGIYELSSEEFYSLYESGYINYTNEDLAYLDLNIESWSELISDEDLNLYSDEDLIYLESELFYNN